MTALFGFGVICVVLGMLVLGPMAFNNKDKHTRTAYYEAAKYAFGVGYVSIVLGFIPVLLA